MSGLYIDSASTNEIIALLRCKQPNEASRWTWHSAIEITNILISCHHVIMAPSPRVYRAASGPYGYLTQKLYDLIEFKKPNPQKEIKAIGETKNWAGKNPRKILKAYESIKADKNNFSNWLQGGITYSWPEHSNRLGGLFDFQFIPEISQVLNLPTNELEKIWNLSKKQGVLENYAKNITDENNFGIMQDAYTVSTLLRGRYHEYLMIGSKPRPSIIHHPIRLPVLQSSKRKEKTKFSVSNVVANLSWITLVSTFAERKLSNKIKCWEENMRKVRIVALREREWEKTQGIKQELRPDSIDLSQKDDDDVAFESALKIAKQLNIRMHPKLLEDALDAIFAGGVSAITSFFLVGWSSFAVSGIAYAASKKIEIGGYAARLLYRKQNHLRDLAKFEPGRIESAWRKLLNIILKWT